MKFIQFIASDHFLEFPKNDKNTNELRRVEVNVMKSLVLSIGENGCIKKTPLMEKTKLDYPRLNLYMNWMEVIGLVNMSGQKITLTENGMRFRSYCLKLIEI